MSKLDKILLLDLAELSVSPYLEIRCTAQLSLNAALRNLVGPRQLIIPPLLTRFERALDAGDFNVIKGSLYTILFTRLKTIISRHQSLSSQLVDLYTKTPSIDKPCLRARVYDHLRELADQPSTYVIINQNVVEALRPREDCTSDIAS